MIIFSTGTGLKKTNFDFTTSSIKLPAEDLSHKIKILGQCSNSVLYCVYSSLKEDDSSGNSLLCCRYYKYFFETGEKQLIAESSGCFTVLGNFPYGEGVIYGEAKLEEQLSISIYYQTNLDKKIKLYAFETVSIPDLFFKEGRLFVSYEMISNTSIRQMIELISVETGKTERIVSEEYSISDGYLCTGKMILGLSGDENGILYQEIVFDHDNPDLDDTGRAQIVYWNLSEQNRVILKKLEKKASFLGGVPEILVVTDYTYEAPLENTGKLYIKKGNGKYASYFIPGIESVNDIKTCDIINERFIVIESFQAVYIIDTNNFEYEKYENMDYQFSEKNIIYCIDNEQLLIKFSLEI